MSADDNRPGRTCNCCGERRSRLDYYRTSNGGMSGQCRFCCIAKAIARQRGIDSGLPALPRGRPLQERSRPTTPDDGEVRRWR